HTFTINVGDSVRLDAKTKGYVRNVSWATNSWDQAGYNNGLPTQINADANVSQVIDLRNIATYGDEGNVRPTDLSVNGEYYGSYATGLKPGTTTVTAYVIDGFFRTPAKITYTIKVVDPKKATEQIAPAQLDKNSFAYPTWLKNAMAEKGLNTDGNKNVQISYESSSPDDVTVDESGQVTYKTTNPAKITATVIYSAMTMDGEPRFETDSHVMTFERTVSKNATHKVSFNSKGGSVVNAKTATYNNVIAKPVNPTRKGFVFAGWYLDESLKTAWNFTTDRVVESKTLYAKWVVASPKSLKATKASSTSIKLTWTGVSGGSGYEISRATASNFSSKVTKTTTKATLTATGLVKGKTYYFKVRAYTVVGNAKVYSNEATVVKYKL
ncbi:InlB B-repeat-containing protein, partial [Bacillus velezensis]|uniref:InlB B-repeat-containing protein n=1 Tax=Bacillus velezensis TaxID=492670 RepID=UPI00300014F1